MTVVNEAGATIQGVGTDSWGIHTGSTPINVTNFGVISGKVNALNVNGGGTFINEAGASITSTTFQPIAVTSGGVENIINSGTISSSFGGIGFSNGNASGTITNNAGGIIQGTGVNSFGIAVAPLTSLARGGVVFASRFEAFRLNTLARDQDSNGKAFVGLSIYLTPSVSGNMPCSILHSSQLTSFAHKRRYSG